MARMAGGTPSRIRLAQMYFAALFRQLDLLLALAKPPTVSLSIFVHAMRALDPGLVDVRSFVFVRDRAPACVAEVVRTLLYAVTNRDAVIEDETLAIPGAFLWRRVFEVLQNAAFEVEHFINPLTQQIRRGLFAADATGAVHCDLLASIGGLVGVPPVGEFAKTGRAGVDGAFKLTNADLIVVAGVDQDDVVSVDQVVPIFRLHVGPDLRCRIDAWLAKGDDFLLQPDFKAQERLILRFAFRPVEQRAARQGAQIGQRCVDAFARSGDGAVDALGRQQNRAFDASVAAAGLNARLQGGGIIETGEVI